MPNHLPIHLHIWVGLYSQVGRKFRQAREKVLNFKFPAKKEKVDPPPRRTHNLGPQRDLAMRRHTHTPTHTHTHTHRHTPTHTPTNQHTHTHEHTHTHTPSKLADKPEMVPDAGHIDGQVWICFDVVIIIIVTNHSILQGSFYVPIMLRF